MIPFPNKKYSVIYADPPWKYQDEEIKKAIEKEPHKGLYPDFLREAKP